MQTAQPSIAQAIQSAQIPLDNEAIEYLVADLASGIHDYSTIAMRWGFTTEAALFDFLSTHPPVVARVKQLKATRDSDQGTAERVKLKSQIAYEETIPSLVSIAKNQQAQPKDRIEAMKELRQSGAIGVVKDGASSGGTQFNLTIMFPAGAKTITTVVDAPTTEVEALPEAEDDE